MVSFQKLSRPRIVTSAAIAIGVVLIYFGFSLAQTGDEGTNLPSAIERLSPADDDRVLRQSEIVIDFIDMKRAENRKLIQDIMRDEMRGDRSKYTMLPLTKFGLMQITRQRVRPEMNVATHETCPSCGGTGSITASIAVSDIVEQHLEHLLTKQNEKKLTLLVHPFLSAYFTKGFPSIRMKWFLQYKTWITIMEDSSFGITEFKFLNQNGDQIEISS